MRDDQLEAALADLAAHVVYPSAPSLAGAVVARLHAPSRSATRRRALALAIVAAIVVLAIVALPEPREAVADWLGISGIRIVRLDTPSTRVGTTLRLGRELPLEEARRTAPFMLVGPAALGLPSHGFIGEPSSTSVNLVWSPARGLPEVRDTTVGLLLTEIPGTLESSILEKRLHADTSFERVTVGTAPAYWISGGQHEVLFVAPDGAARDDTTRLAANTLLWSAAGVTFRLESALDRDAAIALATHLEPIR